MKKSFLAGFILILLFSCSKKEKNIAAIVGEDTIRVTQVDSFLVRWLERDSYREPFWQKPAPDVLLKRRKSCLRRLINYQIVENEAKRLKIKIDVATVSQHIDSIIKAEHSGDRQSFLKKISENRQTEEMVRKIIRDNMTLEAVMESLLVPVATPEDSLRRYYQKYIDTYTRGQMDASIIAVYAPTVNVAPSKPLKQVVLERDSTLKDEKLQKAIEREREKKKKKAETIYQKLKAGEKFESLAKRYSEDKGSAPKGGSLGSINRGYMCPEFWKVAFAMKKGQVSGLVDTKYGYYIIRADSDPVTTVIPFEEEKAMIKEQHDKRKKGKVFQNLVDNYKVIVCMDTLNPPEDIDWKSIKQK